MRNQTLCNGVLVCATGAYIINHYSEGSATVVEVRDERDVVVVTVRIPNGETPIRARPVNRAKVEPVWKVRHVVDPEGSERLRSDEDDD